MLQARLTKNSIEKQQQQQNKNKTIIIYEKKPRQKRVKPKESPLKTLRF